MDVIWIFVIIVLLIIAARELMNYKKLPNNTSENIYHNSKHFRLLLVVIAGVIGIVIYSIRKIFIE